MILLQKKTIMLTDFMQIKCYMIIDKIQSFYVILCKSVMIGDSMADFLWLNEGLSANGFQNKQNMSDAWNSDC